MPNSVSKILLAGVLSAGCWQLPAWQDGDQVSYGKYLVEEVGKCQVCHTPRLDSGELDKSRWLKGAVLDFQPLKPVEGWHKTSPDLTSGSRLFTRWKEEGLVKFLTMGVNPSNGKPADPPMPAFKLNKKDAEAVVAYLKSLK
jgi:mono/diheme cytochrome c family protein